VNQARQNQPVNWRPIRLIARTTAGMAKCAICSTNLIRINRGQLHVLHDWSNPGNSVLSKAADCSAPDIQRGRSVSRTVSGHVCAGRCAVVRVAGTMASPHRTPISSSLTGLGYQQESDRIVVVVEDPAVRHRAPRKGCSQRQHVGMIAVDQVPVHEGFNVAGIQNTG
jgi:hypothetical protein